MADRGIDRWLRPRYVFPALALLLLLAWIFSPAPREGAGRRDLTTYGYEPFAARGAYEVMQRLGWHVQRRRLAFREPLDTTATYVLLDPPVEPSATEVGVLLDAVRHGARALVTPSYGSALADSLGMRAGFLPKPGRVLPAPAGARADIVPVVNAARALDTTRFALRPVPRTEDDTAPRFPADTIQLVRVRADTALRLAIAARPFGRGMVLAVADPAIFRNDAQRRMRAAVLTTRLFEWLDGTRSAPVVFDEYHHGYGMSGGVLSVMARGLFDTAPGRALVQLVVAALVLLVVLGVRPIAPVPRTTIERRSPLEHVGALSRAYEQIEATRLATHRLVRGLRRRHPLGASGGMDDEAYLALLSARKPELAADAALLRDALARRLPAAEWVGVGTAIDHIERTITQ